MNYNLTALRIPLVFLLLFCTACTPSNALPPHTTSPFLPSSLVVATGEEIPRPTVEIIDEFCRNYKETMNRSLWFWPSAEGLQPGEDVVFQLLAFERKSPIYNKEDSIIYDYAFYNAAEGFTYFHNGMVTGAERDELLQNTVEYFQGLYKKGIELGETVTLTLPDPVRPAYIEEFGKAYAVYADEMMQIVTDSNFVFLHNHSDNVSSLLKEGEILLVYEHDSADRAYANQVEIAASLYYVGDNIVYKAPLFYYPDFPEGEKLMLAKPFIEMDFTRKADGWGGESEENITLRLERLYDSAQRRATIESAK